MQPSFKRIAFIGHSYHKKTKSFSFFTEILERDYTVDFFFDETWAGDRPLNISDMNVAEYCGIILWQQINYVFHPDIARHPNVILVPMFDCHAENMATFKKFSGHPHLKFINFSIAQHETCLQYGLQAFSVQYYPYPEKFCCIQKYDPPVGFFWPRRKELDWTVVKQLISGHEFFHMLLHLAPDRGFSAMRPTKSDQQTHHIQISRWFDSKDAFLAYLQNANIYFAPRLYEGIGLSFLEAMAMGMCVVAPNTPTMNEYITHGVNGLLYDHNHPATLDFSKNQSLGIRARESIETGHRRWRNSINDILAFIAPGPVVDHCTRHTFPTPKQLSIISAPSTLRSLVSVALDTIPYPKARLCGGLRTRGKIKRNTEKKPLITIATVTYNAEKELPGTLSSILTQTYDNIELIIVDGSSTDGTLQTVKSNEKIIDLWVSEPDKGPYDAMNKATELARGQWILFLNAGDRFTDDKIIEEVVRNAPGKADIIYGHHYYRHPDGNMFWHKANAFEWTQETLHQGQLTNAWVKGIPCHQATLTKTSLLKKNRYDIERFKYAADHDFLFRMRNAGAFFHHSDLTIAVYTSGGFSWQNAADCMYEQWKIAAQYGAQKMADKFYRKRVKHIKKDQNQDSFSFSKEWHQQESSLGGWMRWLPKSGNIKFQSKKTGNVFIYFQACSLLPDNILTVKTDDHIIFKEKLSTRYSFFGPTRVKLKVGEYSFRFTSKNEHSTPSLDDSRLLGIALKNFSVVEDGLLVRLPILYSKFCSQFTNRFPIGVTFGFKDRRIHWLLLLKTYGIILKSGLFHSNYYRRQYPDIGKKWHGKLRLHYLLKGAGERKNPNHLFDTGYYLDRNPDVAASGINPLYHYIICGATEGREPGPNISVGEYLERNPTFDPYKTNPLRHYFRNSGKIPVKADYLNQKKMCKKNAPFSSTAGKASPPPHRLSTDNIRIQNSDFIDNIRKTSDLKKISFLKKRGEILEAFSRDHYLGGVYEEVIRAFYMKHLCHGEIAVDCGSEVGYHSLALADAVGSRGLVYAIDARIESARQIKKKMGTFQKNILIYTCALSDWDGETSFTAVHGLPGWSSLFPYEKYPREVALRERTVKVRRLDDIIAPPHAVKFIKLDIEGGEYHALLGAEKIVSRHKPVIVFENGGISAANRYHYLLVDFVNYFKRHEFMLFDIIGEKFSPEFLITQHFVNNFIAVPKTFLDNYPALDLFLRKEAVKHIPGLETLYVYKQIDF
jgi:FkbM family methyltransferase